MKEKFSALKKCLPNIRKNIFLKHHTTFKIGGPAKYFFEAKSKSDLIRAISAAQKFNLPFFILGGGSNLLVADKGYRGIVINFQFSIFNFQNSKIATGAGLPLGRLVNASTKKGFSGLEWAVGIPGTIGGAIRGNAGAFGSSMADVVKTIEVLEIRDKRPQNSKTKSQNCNLTPKTFKNKDCRFDYRDSIFKHNPNLIILKAEIQLKKGNKKEIQKKVKEYLGYRKKNHPLEFPSAGSVFKNPRGFSAGQLIEKCNLKGKRIGNVKISEKHANFIVNLGNGRAKDVIKLISLIKKKVNNTFKINLEEEIQFLGF